MRARLANTNINASTGLATDYLNHFNEAIMLLEMLPSCPECIEDFLAWKPLSYRQHFAASHFKDRALAIEGYEAADPAVRQRLDTLSNAMISVLQATRGVMAGEQATASARIAERAAAWLRPLVARAACVINGEAEPDLGRVAPQAAIDLLMQR